MTDESVTIRDIQVNTIVSTGITDRASNRRFQKTRRTLSLPLRSQ